MEPTTLDLGSQSGAYDLSATTTPYIVNETLYTIRGKPLMIHFDDNSKGKIGRQKICNKLKFMDGISLWTGSESTF